MKMMRIFVAVVGVLILGSLLSVVFDANETNDASQQNDNYSDDSGINEVKDQVIKHEEIVNDEFDQMNEKDAAVYEDEEAEEIQKKMDRKLSLELFDHGFSQQKIMARAGETLEINLTGLDGSHNFVIEELGIKSETVDAGEETSITFALPENSKDEYLFYCSVDDHRELGMEGSLIVR